MMMALAATRDLPGVLLRAASRLLPEEGRCGRRAIRGRTATPADK